MIGRMISPRMSHRFGHIVPEIYDSRQQIWYAYKTGKAPMNVLVQCFEYTALGYLWSAASSATFPRLV